MNNFTPEDLLELSKRKTHEKITVRQLAQKTMQVFSSSAEWLRVAKNCKLAMRHRYKQISFNF